MKLFGSIAPNRYVRDVIHSNGVVHYSYYIRYLKTKKIKIDGNKRNQQIFITIIILGLRIKEKKKKKKQTNKYLANYEHDLYYSKYFSEQRFSVFTIGHYGTTR